jgi:hypothetical protein
MVHLIKYPFMRMLSMLFGPYTLVGAMDLGPLYTSDQGPGQIILLVMALGQEP